jgi:hypothetical protein
LPTAFGDEAADVALEAGGGGEGGGGGAAAVVIAAAAVDSWDSGLERETKMTIAITAQTAKVVTTPRSTCTPEARRPAGAGK